MNERDHNVIERRERLLGKMKTYYDVPFHPVRGEGQWLYEGDGRKVLDAYNNVAHVGHCHPFVVEALCRQARTLNTNTRYLFESILDYAEKLTAFAPSGLNACMFTCTGSEANDVAWRLASTFTGGTGALTCRNAYHGNSTFLDTIDGSSPKSERTHAPWWGPVPAPRFSASEYTPRAAEKYAEDVKSAINELKARGHAPAAFYFDTYFCADGVYLPPPGFMDKAIAEIRRAGALIIADEVQAGLSRCGTHMWAVQRMGIEPDMMVLGKPMGNGHPIGAVIVKKEILDLFYAKDRYFNTFAGNPVSSVVGSAVLEVIENENLMENAYRKGEQIKVGFESLTKKFPIIGDVRGQGLLVGLDLISEDGKRTPAGKHARWIINDMCKRGVLIGLTGPNRNERNVLKVRPPMIFDDTGVDMLLSTFEKTLSSLPA